MPHNRSVLITGGTGLLALNWACAVRDSWDVILGTHQHSVNLKGTESFKLDLDNEKQLGCQLDQLSPSLVLHTAGLANVELCEKERDLACQSNAVIARNIAKATASRGIRLVHISTDHLFAGERSFYRENDSLRPLNEYARTKALAEEWVRAAHPKALIVRTNFFCWGHRQRQSLSDWLICNLRGGKALTAFDDVFFTPILADRLASVAHALVENGVCGVTNLVGDERLSKYAFALQLAEAFGLPVELIRRAQSAQSHLQVRRPLDMSLDNNRVRQALGGQVGGVAQFLYDLRVQEEQGRRAELFESVRALV